MEDLDKIRPTRCSQRRHKHSSLKLPGEANDNKKRRETNGRNKHQLQRKRGCYMKRLDHCKELRLLAKHCKAPQFGRLHVSKPTPSSISHSWQTSRAADACPRSPSDWTINPSSNNDVSERGCWVRIRHHSIPPYRKRYVLATTATHRRGSACIVRRERWRG